MYDINYIHSSLHRHNYQVLVSGSQLSSPIMYAYICCPLSFSDHNTSNIYWLANGGIEPLGASTRYLYQSTGDLRYEYRNSWIWTSSSGHDGKQPLSWTFFIRNVPWKRTSPHPNLVNGSRSYFETSLLGRMYSERSIVLHRSISSFCCHKSSVPLSAICLFNVVLLLLVFK